MGLAALNPLSRLRGAIRGLVATAVADVMHDALSGFGTALHGAEARTGSKLEWSHGCLVDAIRESETRTCAEIASLRACMGVVGDPVVEPPPSKDRGALSGDPCRPRDVKPGPSLEQRQQANGLSMRETSPADGLVGKRRHP